jgi:pyrroloquinoline quinone (PQQ) biosynthesis protein C
MTSIANHAELDVDHVEEALASIDDLVEEPAKIRPMMEVLRRSIASFDAFCLEVTRQPEESTRDVDAAVPASHVSAA